MSSIQANLLPNLSFNHFQASTHLVGVGNLQCRVNLRKSRRKLPSYSCIRCEKKDEVNKDDEKKDEVIDYVMVERPPYYSYMDSTSGQLEPASGARASIPEVEYWPEGTVEQVRSASAPTPKGESLGSPSYGSNPGSRRKSYRTSVSGSSVEGDVEDNVEDNVEGNDTGLPEVLVEQPQEDLEEFSSDYVVYQSEAEEEVTGYKLDKKFGAPHPFVDPEVKKTIDGTLTSEELWWNWRKPEKEQWSRWQRRRPDTETVFLKAMAETGQVKLYGEEPTLTETALYRARRHLYKEERLEAEQEKMERIGPIAYYSEWVKAWKGDTSREAIQKHFEETGEDETAQLIEMFSHQTAGEYRIMMGTDIRIQRDPLAMRMREDQIKQIWGGDPVYPTVNYIQDPDEVIDYRGPDFHEPTPNMLSYLKEHGKIISREELEKLLEKQKTEQVEVSDIDVAMAKAVDIGENDDEEDSDIDVEEAAGEEEEEVEADGDEEVEEDESKITRNWSVLKTTPQLLKSKPKPKKEGPMTLDEALGDSENLTDFLLDFEAE